MDVVAAQREAEVPQVVGSAQEAERRHDTEDAEQHTWTHHCLLIAGTIVGARRFMGDPDPHKPRKVMRITE